MSWRLTEPLIVAIGTYLATNIPAKIVAINAAYADGNNLVAFLAADYYQSEKAAQSIPGKNAIIIRDVGLTAVMKSVSATGNGWLSERANIEIVVLETEQGTSWNRARQRVSRWRQAVLELLVEAEATSLSGWIFAQGVTFGVMGAYTKEDSMLDSSSIVIQFSKTEAKA